MELRGADAEEGGRSVVPSGGQHVAIVADQTQPTHDMQRPLAEETQSHSAPDMADPHSSHVGFDASDRQTRTREAHMDEVVSAETPDALPVRPQKRSMHSLRPSEVVRLLNSTPLGNVTSDRQFYRIRIKAGLRIGDGQRINFLRLVAWLAARRHGIIRDHPLTELHTPSTPFRRSATPGTVVTAHEVHALLVQQDFRCALTGAALKPTDAAMDHILAVSRNGPHTIDNAQILRKDVNRAKGTLTNEEFLKLCRAVVQHADRVEK